MQQTDPAGEKEIPPPILRSQGAASASFDMARSSSSSSSSSSSDSDRRRKPSKRRNHSPEDDGARRDDRDDEGRGGGDRGGDRRSPRRGGDDGRGRDRSRDTRSRGRDDGRSAGEARDRDGRAGGRRDLRDDIGAGDRRPPEPRERKPLSAGRAGGTYIPPFKLAQMMAEQTDKTSPEYQRMTWDALKKSINGLVNKVNSSNIKNILPELFAENMIRGRGLFARSVMKSQMASPHFSPVFAALVAVVNTKFPELGELVLKRVILQFRRAFKRNDKPVCVAASRFLAHLINQQVVHELLALELLTVLLSTPTNDSVEVAIEFVKECGYTLHELTPQGLHGIFERFRGILHEGDIDKRVQFMIEGLFAVRKAGFEGKKGVPQELDLVDEEDQIVHELSLDDELQAEATLDVFKVDPEYEENEKKYSEIKKEILGESSSDEEDDSDGSDESDEESDEEEAAHTVMQQQAIQDQTETNLVNLRRTIYLTIMSSLDFEEAVTS